MAENSPGTLRKIPSVTFLLTLPPFEDYLVLYPRTLILQVLRGLLDGKREELLAGRPTDITPEGIWQETGQRLKSKTAYHLRRVVNGTGVVIHTNLGRSLLASRAVSQMEAVARNYSNLEYDLDRGERGSRYSHVEGLLLELTGAEAALVVNNNAAAVLLALDSLARGREVVVSRGQLIEIGGSFRIPEVMSRSGAILREVGTTNKTHMRDYENALSDRTALLLKVHTSNFRLLGFTAEVSLERLVGLGRTHRIPVMEDLGSGSLLDLSPFGLEKEPTVQEAVRSGADLVSFSGDKLLGGPQAGIIVGREAMIQLLRQNPLNRALRIDKLTLAALEATLHLYRRPDQALREIPTLAAAEPRPARTSAAGPALVAPAPPGHRFRDPNRTNAYPIPGRRGGAASFHPGFLCPGPDSSDRHHHRIGKTPPFPGDTDHRKDRKRTPAPGPAHPAGGRPSGSDAGVEGMDLPSLMIFLMSSFFLANPKNWWVISDLVREEIGPLLPFNDLFLIPSSAAPHDGKQATA